MIVVVDYGVGNIGAIRNMLKRIGVDSIIANDDKQVSCAEKLILLGVGSFDYGMENLRRSNLVDVLNKKVLSEKTPVLGICLGVQLMTENSEGGKESGLGWIKGRTVAFDKAKLGQALRIPHMGWTRVYEYQESKLFEGVIDDPRFYFVHSYHLCLEDAHDIMVKANYGYSFAAGLERQNILGVQFHPEKSHKYGMQLLQNFVKYY